MNKKQPDFEKIFALWANIGQTLTKETMLVIV
jgi:hypothetical protein